MNINPKLKEYIEQNVFPKYEKYYSHGMIHINNVINNIMILAEYYNLDPNISYVIACYHDIGLNVNRENHECESGKILYNDTELRKYFDIEEIKTMKDAVEDHRGSRKEKPRNFYGECLSDSDRDFDIRTLAKRQLAVSLKNYTELKTFEEHFERSYNYICRRINNKGVFNLWTNNPLFVQRRDKFQRDYLNKEYTKSIYKEEWNNINSDGTIEKIINYYEDF